METREKNNVDTIIFLSTKCIAGATFSIYHKAELYIQLAIPPA